MKIAMRILPLSNRQGSLAKLSFTTALLLFLYCQAPAVAATLNTWVVNSSASSGSSGTFDVAINSPGGAIAINSFTIMVSVPSNSGITLLSASSLTNALNEPYVFTGIANSTFSPVVNSASAITITATASSYSVNVGAATVGLADVSFAVSPGAAGGPVTVTLSPSVFSPNGDPVPTGASNGSITVTPEPALLSLFALAGSFSLLRRARLQKR